MCDDTITGAHALATAMEDLAARIEVLERTTLTVDSPELRLAVRQAKTAWERLALENARREARGGEVVDRTDAPRKSALWRLAAAYMELKAYRDTRLHLSQELSPAGDPVPAGPAETAQDQLSEAMYDMAWKAAATRAFDFAGLRAKAHVLQDWVGQEGEDLTDKLTASLCRDILALR